MQSENYGCMDNGYIRPGTILILKKLLIAKYHFKTQMLSRNQ